MRGAYSPSVVEQCVWRWVKPSLLSHAHLGVFSGRGAVVVPPVTNKTTQHKQLDALELSSGSRSLSQPGGDAADTELKRFVGDGGFAKKFKHPRHGAHAAHS